MPAKVPSYGPIIIIGAHRSGTAMVTRLLERLGVFVGWRLDENHEAYLFRGYNSWLMSSSGGRWDNPATMDTLLGDDRGLELAEEYLRMRLSGPATIRYFGLRRYLKYRSLFRVREPWGWKDPRNTLTLPVWLRLFPEAKVIHVVRHGVDVAASLRRRQEEGLALAAERLRRYRLLFRIKSKSGWFGSSPRMLKLDQGFRLWEEYLDYAERLRGSISNPFLEIRFETFLAEPEDNLARLAVFCGLDPGGERMAAARAIMRRDRRFAFMKDEGLRRFAEGEADSPWIRRYRYSPEEIGEPPAQTDGTLPAKTQKPPNAFRVLVVDGSVELSEIGRQPAPSEIHCLFWLAPDTRSSLENAFGCSCRDIGDLAGDREAWERRAYAQAKAVFKGGHEYDGKPWRDYMAEALYREALQVVAYRQVGESITAAANGASGQGVEVVYGIHPEMAGVFRTVVASICPEATLVELGSPFGSKAGAPRRSLAARLGRRLQEVLATGGLRAQVYSLLDELDASYTLRCRRPRRTARVTTPDGVTFFTSYLNNSRTLMEYRPLVPAPVHWVALNYQSRRTAEKAGEESSWLWEFRPAYGEKMGWEESARRLLQSPEDDHAGELEAWLSASPAWSYWRAKGARTLVNLTRCWEAYLDHARPKAVFMASLWGIEGWLAHVARARGVPVVQILHGWLGGYFYTGLPIAADLFVVPGEYWRDLWPAEERGKIIVCNPHKGLRMRTTTAKPGRRPPQITFFSWPNMWMLPWNHAEMTDGLVKVFRSLLDRRDLKIHVRAHPLENPADFLQRWKKCAGELPGRVTVGKHEPLDEVLEATDCAVMFRSTVLLDCVTRGIPVVVPGWVDFGVSESLREIKGIHLAGGFSDVERILAELLETPSPILMESAGRLLAPEGEGKGEFNERLPALMGYSDGASGARPARQCEAELRR